jgi:AraC-like DNA-binding protein
MECPSSSTLQKHKHTYFHIRERDEIALLEPVVEEQSGKQGQPTKTIDPNYLKEAMSPKRHISLSALARKLKMHRNTLRRKMKLYGINRKFDEISDANLDQLVSAFKAEKPNSGLRYLIGFLRRHGLRIQRERVRQALRRVDGLGQELRRRATIQRRKYHVPRPNFLWHLDGHHKLIWWGIVIHGLIDGYCRTVSIRLQ